MFSATVLAVLPTSSAFLMTVLPISSAFLMTELLGWMTWICAYEDDPLAAALPSSLAMCHTAVIADMDNNEWQKVVAAVQALYSRHSERRQQGSRVLRSLLGSDWQALTDEDLSKMPHCGEWQPLVA
jgi:hypothetical protein